MFYFVIAFFCLMGLLCGGLLVLACMRSSQWSQTEDDTERPISAPSAQPVSGKAKA